MALKFSARAIVYVSRNEFEKARKDKKEKNSIVRQVGGPPGQWVIHASP